MIHTMDISTPLTSFRYQQLLYEYGEPLNSRSWTTDAFALNGITELAVYEVDKPHFKGYFMSITMNPQFVMTQAFDPISLFDLADFAQLIPIFDDLMQSITSISLPSLPYWTATRIDYAMDIEVDNQPDRPGALEYLELARRGFVPQRKKEKGQPGWISYYVGNKSSTVRVYHRGPALRARIPGLAQSVYLAADRTLRFEVECNKGRLVSLAKKHGFRSRQVQHFMTRPEIGLAELQRQAEQIFGIHDYVSYRKAAAQIKRACLQLRAKTELLQLMKAIDTAKGIAAAQAKWSKGKSVSNQFARKRIPVIFTPAQQRRIVKRLDEQQINMVPVPPCWRMKKVENPFIDFWRQRGLRR